LARRILLADDSVTAQNMGRRILTDAGYEVVTVNNGSAALKKIAENKPDLIVLDVYMPGYGGLEVCQRVKENPETKPIPVLLTVGKLEPFKADEARRVGADAFIVKPFEATELLTVLTKLEDKIVAQPQSQKSGRFAKALAAVQQSDTGDRFGDKETGWKNRLIIPPANVKSKADERPAENIPAASLPPEPVEAVRPVEPTREFERPIPAGLPVDITPEEIAAITAAAAASFGGKSEEPVAKVESETPAEPLITQASTPEATQDVQASTTVESAPVETVREAVASVEVESTTASRPEEPQAETVAIEAPQPDATTEPSDSSAVAASLEPSINSETPATAPLSSTSGDDEVLAALASLAPSHSYGVESGQLGANGSNGASVGVSASARLEEATGPRWIAELVELTTEDSKVLLDLEMEQAAARASVVAASIATEAVSNVTLAAVEATALEATTVEPVTPAVGVIASVEAINASESSPSPSVEEPTAPAMEVVEAHAVQEHIPAPVVEESAYAAAAAAGSVGDQSPPVEAVSTTTSAPQSHAAAEVEAQPQREAELTAAWQNWKQIRDSIANPKKETSTEARAETTSQSEAVAAHAQSEVAKANVVPDEDEETTSDAPEESTAIASIVDTMLAELRPKLVAEIAKKMSSEKKEKEKKKKK